MRQPLLTAEDAAKLVEACADQFRGIVDVSGAEAQTSASAYVCNRMIAALAEALRGRGSSRITKTYKEWSILANARGVGKTTKPDSLRAPFSKWKDELRRQLVPARAATLPESAKGAGVRALKFSIITPEAKGKRGGEAGIRVVFLGQNGEAIAVRSPEEIVRQLPIDRELERIAKAQEFQPQLDDARETYLARVREWFGVDEAAKREKALKKAEAGARSRWLSSAAVWIIGLVGVFAIAGSVIAGYRERHERLQQMFKYFSIGMIPNCNEMGQPVNHLTFSESNAKPPFTVLRDGEPIATLEAAEDGIYRHDDLDVQPGRSYVYSIGQQVWGIGRYVTTPSVTIKTHPNCRPASNLKPVVRAIYTLPDAPRVGEPFDIWVDAFDPNGDRLTYRWSIHAADMYETGQRIRTSIGTAGRYNVGVHVDDGFEPPAYAGRVIGIAAVNPTNRPPTLGTLIAAPLRVRPGQEVVLLAPASDADGDALQYEWDYDNDWEPSERTQRRVEVSYSVPGIYHPSVTVFDPSLATAGASATVEVVANAPAPALQCAENLTISTQPLNPPVNTPTTLTVTLGDDSVRPTRVLWDYGDGTPLHSARSLVAKHQFRHRGVYSLSAVLVKGDQERIVCKGTVVVGEPSPSQPSARPLRGRITPERGTTTTQFTFVALPSGNTNDYDFRWEMRHRAGREAADTIVDTKVWQRGNTYTTQLSKEGLWEIAYIARKRDGSGQHVETVGDAFVLPDSPTAPTVPPNGTH